MVPTALRPTPGARRYGRDLEDAIFEAVFEELAQVGYARLSFDSVAKRAGTGKAAIYRRWRNKSDLVSDAFVAKHAERPPFVSTGDLRADLIAFFTGIFLSQTDATGSMAFRGLVGEADRFPEMFASVRERTWNRDMESLKNLLLEAAERGDLDRENLLPEVLDAIPLILSGRSLLDMGPTKRDIVRNVDHVLLPLLCAVSQ
jgi:AcrR family transcriptional regulator